MTSPPPTRDGFLDLIRRRIVVAPMAGGPTTAGLVIAAARAGALGFLAAGYKTPEAMTAEIGAVRAATAEPFGSTSSSPAGRTVTRRRSPGTWTRSARAPATPA